MGAVIGPFARCGDPLAGRDYWGMPDHRDEISVAACLDPQNAETVLLVVEGDALDETRQHLAVGWFGLNFHEPRHRWGCPLASTERAEILLILPR
jgi:hypothetical protein